MTQGFKTSPLCAELSGKALQEPWAPSVDELVDWLAACCDTRAVDLEAVLPAVVKEAPLRCLAEALATLNDPRPRKSEVHDVARPNTISCAQGKAATRQRQIGWLAKDLSFTPRALSTI